MDEFFARNADSALTSSRWMGALWCALFVISGGLLPVVKLVYFNMQELGPEYVLTLSYLLGVGVLVFVAVALLYHRWTVNMLMMLACGVVLSSTISTFFLPNHLSIVDGHGLDYLKTRWWAQDVLFIVTLLMLILSFFMKKFRLVERVCLQLVWVSKLLVLFSLAAGVLISVQLGVNSHSTLQKRDAVKSLVFGQRNFLVLSFDQVQGSAINGYLNSSSGQKLKNVLDGFVFYPNAVSTYPNTRYSIASTLLGRAVDYRTENVRWALNHQDGIFEISSKNGYHVYFDDDIKHHFHQAQRSLPALLPLNAANVGFGFIIASVLPQSLSADALTWTWKFDSVMYKEVLPKILRYDPHLKGAVYFLHFKFTHEPFMTHSSCRIYGQLDAKVTETVKGFIETADCVSLGLKEMFSRMKALGIYDKTAIFVVSDHGFERHVDHIKNIRRHPDFFAQHAEYVSPGNIKPLGAYNPLMMFKDFNHSGMLTKNPSDVSLIDLAPTICSRMKGCKAVWAGMALENAGSDSGRVHCFWFYHGGVKETRHYHDFLPRDWKKVCFSQPLNRPEAIEKLEKALSGPGLGKDAG